MSTHSGGELSLWPTMLRRSASISALNRRGGFGSHVLNSLVKLVLQQSDKQLESIHKQLCSSAKDIGVQLIQISTLMGEITTSLKTSRPDERGDHGDVAHDWKRISKEYAACLVGLRSSAISGATIINDFLCEFSAYMLSAEDSVNAKSGEARLYAERMVSESKQTCEGISVLGCISRNICDFRIQWSRDGRLSAEADAKTVIILEKLENITTRRPSDELTNMLDNCSFPGVVPASMALLPMPWATQLFKLLEGDMVSKVETLQNRPIVVRPLNILSNLLGVCKMLSQDLIAVDKALSRLTGEKQIGEMKAKLSIVFMSYSSFSDALKSFESTLLRMPLSANPRPQARAFEYNQQATLFRISMVDPSVQVGTDVLHDSDKGRDDAKADDKWSFFLWLLSVLRRMAQQARKMDHQNKDG